MQEPGAQESVRSLWDSRYSNGAMAGMALTNAERQRRFRERRRAAVPVVQRPERPAGRPKPRPARWTAAVAELRTLQVEYEAWRDQLPESLADSRTAEPAAAADGGARRFRD